MIGYTPAEMDWRAAHGLPPATGRDDPPAPPAAQAETRAAA